MNKILTIVIPAYNVENYLDEILPTFLDNELLNDIEIIIVNDGSKDNTAIIASEYEKKYPQTVVLIDKENGGHGSTINSGIKHANGKYLRVIDGDDWVDTNALKNFVNKLKSLDEDLVLTPFNNVYITNNQKEKIEFKDIIPEKKYSFEEVSSSLSRAYQIHSATFKTEILHKIPKIAENCFYVDQEFIMYPIPFIKTLMLIDETVYQYRLGTSGQSVAVKSQQKNRQMLARVTTDLAKYMKELKLDGVYQDMMYSRISGMLHSTVKAYHSIRSNKNIYEEWKKFVEIISNYVDVNSKRFSKIDTYALKENKISYMVLSNYYYIKTVLTGRL
ncbi:glycosyltransferase family A protein [Ligilactobacillus salivarius]|uniref:glycosyltransferase family 2 protein n=1 Tax=Ligilactobacillus salivarius TaxID=1624 RepID=UPI0030F65B11